MGVLRSPFEERCLSYFLVSTNRIARVVLERSGLGGIRV